MAQIEITNKRAVYVNGYRITDRSTKWGVHHTAWKFPMSGKEAILKELQEYKDSGTAIGEIDEKELEYALTR